MTLMISQLLTPIGVCVLALFCMWGFISILLWLSDVVWNAVDDASDDLKIIRYNPIDYG
jgi:hypothetical protein